MVVGLSVSRYRIVFQVLGSILGSAVVCSISIGISHMGQSRNGMAIDTVKSTHAILKCKKITCLIKDLVF